MIVVINLSKPRKSIMNALGTGPICISGLFISNFPYTQDIFNFLGIVGYPTLYTLFEITKIKNAVSPYSLREFYKYYNEP